MQPLAWRCSKAAGSGARKAGRFAYFETPGHAGTVIEISDISGSKGRFFEKVKAAAVDWDGSNPVRMIG